MKTTIGAFDPITKAVQVGFIEGDIKHYRDVNACVDGEGKYDLAATKKRVVEVALGVAAKIEAGVIS